MCNLYTTGKFYDGYITQSMPCLQFHPLTITGGIHDSESLIVQGSGSDEIVVCAWDGMTYIVDQQRNSVRFQFEQNVSAFTAGTMVN